MIARPDTTPPNLQQAELDWWEKFAEVEDRFCWVQPPWVQRVLRGHYLNEIVQQTRPGGRILELGCGSGWLSALLASKAKLEVVGVDFSETQIQFARKKHPEYKAQGSLKFHCLNGTKASVELGSFDTVVAHGFLHHLNTTEIQATLTNIHHLLSADGRFILFEPILDYSGEKSQPNTWIKLSRELGRLANRGVRFNIRHYCKEEIDHRETIKSRDVGHPPHGPSPKEIPFSREEILALLTPLFSVIDQKPCMMTSHQVAQEWLLRELSHPLTSCLLLPWVVRLAALLDKLAIRNNGDFPGIWEFYMYICRKKSPI